MAICVWCGFDKLEATAESCGVCGQSPDSDSVTVVTAARLMPVTGTPTEFLPERPSSTAVSRIFASHYLIEEVVGRGGMGSVFRVMDHRDGGTYALKILHVAAESGSTTLKRFEREAEMLARITHDGVPRIHDFGIAGGSMYLVVDFIDGLNLRDSIAAAGAFAVSEVVRIGCAIAECLDVAHQQGIIHRDIKPHNVMMTPERQIRLIDFGVARDASVNATAITATNMMVGTPHYMSPEQFDGRAVDARSDIYSLGVLLFELATGRLPFRGETPTSLAILHTTEPPPHPRALRADIPMLLDRVILKCLEKRPGDRYPTAADVGRDLQRSLEARRTVERTRIGDFVVHEETDEWALVLASPRERAWPAGMTLLFSGSYFKVARVDYDASYPAPYVYRFNFSPENEAIRRFVDYDAESPPPEKGWRGKWLK